jgi:hypothetical protein
MQAMAAGWSWRATAFDHMVFAKFMQSSCQRKSDSFYPYNATHFGRQSDLLECGHSLDVNTVNDTQAKLNKNINSTCKVLAPWFLNWNKISQKCSICTKSSFLSNIVHKFVYIPVSEHFSVVKIIHPPHISRSWLNSTIITQVHLVLGTIKSLSKMCIFVTQHNTTDLSHFERACNWNADCRNVYQSCWQRILCSLLHHKSPPTQF